MLGNVSTICTRTWRAGTITDRHDMTDMLSRHTDHDDSNKEAKAAKPHMARMQHNKAGSKKVLFLLEGGNLARAYVAEITGKHMAE